MTSGSSDENVTGDIHVHVRNPGVSDLISGSPHKSQVHDSLLCDRCRAIELPAAAEFLCLYTSRMAENCSMESLSSIPRLRVKL